MAFSLHPFKEIEPSLIPQVAKLHESALPILLSKMGYPFVLHYFQAAAKEPDMIGFYAMSEANELIGYVVGTPRPDELNSRLTRPLWWFLWQCVRLLFTRPRILWQAIVSTLTLSKQVASTEDSIEVVYMSVDPKARGQGLGRALMQALHDASRAAGYKRVMGSQELDNDVSIGLLGSMGYKVLYNFREGHYERQRIELVL
jgi:GNAT superfamily N-acetyltransferase